MDDFDEQTDSINLTEMRDNLVQIMQEVQEDHAHKVVVNNGVPAAVLINLADYQALRDRLRALKLEATVKEMLEAHARNELGDWDDLVAEFGFNLAPQHEKPEGYDAMIPKRYRSAS